MKNYFKKRQILQRINQGDKDTFLKMYDFYTVKLFRHAYYRVSSKQVAEDIVQQVFLKTWQYLMNSENMIEDINAFLYKLTNNLIIDYYRKAERKNTSLDSDLERKLPIEPSYIKETNQSLEVDKVRKSLNLLKLEQQKVIIWRYLDGLSIKEITQLTGKSKNAVYVALHRALKELQKIIKEEHEII